MTEEICTLLGEGIITSPGSVTRLLSHQELHRLLEISGGAVRLRRKTWKIVPRRYGRDYVRIELREE